MKCSGVFTLVLERREVKERKVQRLTASAVFHEIRILAKYVETMTDSVRIYVPFINESLKLDVLGESLLTHDAPHLIDVSQGLEVFVIVVVEGALQGHAVHPIGFSHKAKQFSQPQFEAVHPLQ